MDGAARCDSEPESGAGAGGAERAFADGTPWSMPANLTYRALDWNFNNMQNPTTWRASASYVTGRTA